MSYLLIIKLWHWINTGASSNTYNVDIPNYNRYAPYFYNYKKIILSSD